MTVKVQSGRLLGGAALAALTAAAWPFPDAWITAAGAEPAAVRLLQLAQASPQKSTTAPAAKKSPPGKSSPGVAPAATAPAAGGDAGLRQRVESLEEQLVDLQVTIGTLESLAKSGGGAAATAPAWRSGSGGGSASAGDQARLDGIETQIRALTAQLEQLSAQVRQGGAGATGATGRRDVAGYRASETGPGGGFGSTTVTPGGPDGDAIGGLISGNSGAVEGAPAGGAAGNAPGNATAGNASAATRQQAAIAPPPPSGASDPGAKQLYETAYGHLLQQDYGAAEDAFDDFLKRYPNDGLSGNAQYWLGESHYVRGQYKAAAQAFLKGYQTYGRSAKAPDSLLKLAMSLDRLGQKDAACSSYGELASKFPSAPAHVKARAQSERQRIGCP